MTPDLMFSFLQGFKKILDPQANLCSRGKSKTMDVRERLKKFPDAIELNVQKKICRRERWWKEKDAKEGGLGTVISARDLAKRDYSDE
jgi:hypothetical protein